MKRDEQYNILASNGGLLTISYSGTSANGKHPNTFYLTIIQNIYHVLRVVNYQWFLRFTLLWIICTLLFH